MIAVSVEKPTHYMYIGALDILQFLSDAHLLYDCLWICLRGLKRNMRLELNWT